MKQELLIATVLLATGAGLCLWQNDTNPNSNSSLQRVANPQITTRSTLTEETLQAEQHAASEDVHQDYFVQQASNWQAQPSQPSGLIQTNQNQPVLNRRANPDSEISINTPDQFKIARPDPESQALLLRLAKQINSSGPVQSTFEMKSRLYDVELIAQGRYWQIGQGTRKSRMELVFGEQQRHRSLVQLCDGRFVFRVKQTGDRQQINFIDLQRLQNQEANLTIATMPAAWVSQGSIANLFEHFASAFKFNPPKAATTNDETIYQLVGDWRAQELYRLLDGIVENQHLNSIIEPEHVPTQIPHAVKLVVKSDRNNRLTPVSIQFLRYEDAKFDGEIGNAVVEINFDRFENIATLDERLFSLQSSDGEATDMTDVYNRKIETLFEGRPKVAEQADAQPSVR